jgi:hypothetical protein
VTPEEVAARFDNRPGYRIIDFGLVGLPIFKVTAIGLTLLKKSINPVEEFVLRSIAVGLTAKTDIAGLLGVSETIVSGVLTDMILHENVIVVGSDGNDRCSLTAKGRRVVEEQGEIKPTQQTLPFTYDALLRKAKWYRLEQLYTPRELKEREIPEVRAFPDRGPDLHELEVREIAEVLTLAAGRQEDPLSLLRLTSVEKRLRLFQEAVALAYRSHDGKTVQIGFAVDGRMSEAHAIAFAESKGVDRNPIFRDLAKSSALIDVAPLLGPSLVKRVSGLSAIKSRSEVAKARSKMLAAKQHVESARIFGDDVSMTAMKLAESDLQEVLSGRNLMEVRAVEVYEHPGLLQDALETAHSRVLIISPWIRAGVVDASFLLRIERLLKRGVALHVGYGLGEKDGDARVPDRNSEAALYTLAAKYSSFNISRLGDTHAKVLIKDSEFFVISSFNWLSFRGEASRTFREELGTLVRIPARVDELYKKLLKRFDKDEKSVQ